MKILAVSDVEVPVIYSASIKDRFSDVDLVISCGDLPHFYLEYIISTLDKPLYYVNGNHTSKPEISDEGERNYPWGGTNIHLRVLRDPSGLLIAGIEGCLDYNHGPHQYSESEMWGMAFGIAAGLLLNRMRFGRYLDILVTHASPWKIHDGDDRPHRGVKAFRWLNRVFKPALHLHGHVHILRQFNQCETQYESTRVVNACGYTVIEI
jgi:Icc-related predicted phosphoesterase